MIRIVQCWDDGVEDDIRLCELLREFGARASFNLNPGLHGVARSSPWRYENAKDVRRLARGELTSVYEGFTIANHTLSHPWSTRIELADWKREVEEGRQQLQDWFGQPVTGFAYPFGDYNDATADIVRQAGHSYARTCRNATPSFPPDDPMKMVTDCHHAAPDFWDCYEQAKTAGAAIFYFWGHSYEFMDEGDWDAFATKLQRFQNDPVAEWADLPDLFPTDAINFPR